MRRQLRTRDAHSARERGFPGAVVDPFLYVTGLHLRMLPNLLSYTWVSLKSDAVGCFYSPDYSLQAGTD